MLSAKEAPMKEKSARWKPTHIYLRCYEECTVLCVDGVDGEWGRYRICCVIMGVISVGADLPCSPVLDWGMIASML